MRIQILFQNKIMRICDHSTDPPGFSLSLHASIVTVHGSILSL